jgi:ABC-type thiamine transport system substrate-binding protein
LRALLSWVSAYQVLLSEISRFTVTKVKKSARTFMMSFGLSGDVVSRFTETKSEKCARIFIFGLSSDVDSRFTVTKSEKCARTFMSFALSSYVG